MTLSKEQILSADDLETRVVDVPEWGGTANIKALSGTERNAYEQSIMRQKGNVYEPNLANSLAKLVARCLVDDAGERLFTDAEVSALGKKNAAVLSRLSEVAAEMSGLSESDVDELAKNSEAGAEDDVSTSPSPEMSLVAP